MKGGKLIYYKKFVPMFFVIFTWSLWHNSLCYAIDNPDVPDIVAEFEARAQKFGTSLQQAQNTSTIAHAYFEYETFLDQELNQTYSALMKQLSGENIKKLTQSQKQWLHFRDTEFLFVNSNWTVESFGSSSALSRGAFRTTIIRDRVIELLHYLKNYRGPYGLDALPGSGAHENGIHAHKD